MHVLIWEKKLNKLNLSFFQTNFFFLIGRKQKMRYVKEKEFIILRIRLKSYLTKSYSAQN